MQMTALSLLYYNHSSIDHTPSVCCFMARRVVLSLNGITVMLQTCVMGVATQCGNFMSPHGPFTAADSDHVDDDKYYKIDIMQ
jgi:hypothetical protein